MTLSEAIDALAKRGGRLCWNGEKVLISPPESLTDDILAVLKANKAEAKEYAQKTAGLLTETLLAFPGSKVISSEALPVSVPKPPAETILTPPACVLPFIWLYRAALRDPLFPPETAQEVKTLFSECYRRDREGKKYGARVARLEQIEAWWTETAGKENEGEDPFAIDWAVYLNYLEQDAEQKPAQEGAAA